MSTIEVFAKLVLKIYSLSIRIYTLDLELRSTYQQIEHEMGVDMEHSTPEKMGADAFTKYATDTLERLSKDNKVYKFYDLINRLFDIRTEREALVAFTGGMRETLKREGFDVSMFVN